MNQTPDDPDTPQGELSAEQEESVRRLLAQARVSEPMPEPVRERLDRVLRDLADGTPTGIPRTSTPAPLVDLAERRRRRVRAVLVAAAAVTVIGVAVPQLVQTTGSDEMNRVTSASDEAPAAGAPREGAAQESTEGRDSYLTGESAPEDDGTAVPSPAAVPPTLRSSRFAQDAQELRDRIALGLDTADSAFGGLDRGCLAISGIPAMAKQTVIPVRYAGRDAALILRKPVAGSQRAILYVCGESGPRRTTMLTVR